MAADKIVLQIDVETGNIAAQLDAGVLNPLADVSVEAKEAGKAITKSLVDAANNTKAAFVLDNVNKEFQTVSATAKKMGVEIVSVFENVGAEAKGTVVNLKDIEKANAANAATAKGVTIAINQEAKAMENASKEAKKDSKATEVLADNTRTLRSELRVLKEQIADGVFEGAEFDKAIEDAARLTGQIKETDRLIKTVASNTRGIDAIVTGAQGIAAGFSVAAGAVSLFGDENENAQILIQKTQGALALLTGVQELARIATDKNALAIGGLTVAERINAIATTGSTKILKIFGIQAEATSLKVKLLRGALLGITGAFIIAGISYLIDLFSDTSEATKKATDEAKELQKAYDSLGSSLSNAFSKFASAEIDLSVVQGKLEKFQGDRIKSFNTAAAELRGISQKLADDETAILDKLNEDYKFGSEGRVAAEAIAFEQIRKLNETAEIERAAITKRGQLEVLNINKEESKRRIDEQKKLNDQLANLYKQRVNAEIAAERAKLQVVLALTKDGSELNEQARIDLIEFELRATKRLLQIEFEERKKALRETNAATKADYDALTNEINARRIQAEQQTQSEIIRIGNESRSQQFQDEKEFQERLKQIELDRIEFINAASKNAADEIRRREIQNRINNSGDQDRARLKANNDLILLERDRLIDDLNAEERQLKSGLIEGTEERFAVENEFNEKRKTVNKQTNDAIARNNKEFRNNEAVQIIDGTARVINEVFNLQNSLFERRIKMIQEESDFTIKTANFTAAQRARQEEITAAKISAIRRKQAQQEKAAAIASIILNTAAAIVRFLVQPGGVAGVALSVAAGITGALQLATAIATPIPKFKDGGEIKGRSHSSGGQLIEAEGGEFITKKTRYQSEPNAMKAFNDSQKAWDNYIYKNYVAPELVYERMKNAQDSGRAVKSEKDRKIEVRTSRLENKVDKSTKQSKKNTREIVNAIDRNKDSERSKW